MKTGDISERTFPNNPMKRACTYSSPPRGRDDERLREIAEIGGTVLVTGVK